MSAKFKIVQKLLKFNFKEDKLDEIAFTPLFSKIAFNPPSPSPRPPSPPFQMALNSINHVSAPYRQFAYDISFKSAHVFFH